MKKLSLLLALFFAFSTLSYAQYVEEDYEDVDEDEIFEFDIYGNGYIGYAFAVGELAKKDALTGGFGTYGMYGGYDIKGHLINGFGGIAMAQFSFIRVDDVSMARSYEDHYNIDYVNVSTPSFINLNTIYGLYYEFYGTDKLTATVKGGIGFTYMIMGSQSISWSEDDPINGLQTYYDDLFPQVNIFGFTTNIGGSVEFFINDILGVGFDVGFTTISNSEVKLIAPYGDNEFNKTGRSPNVGYLNFGLSIFVQ